jgi:probable phosphomutase (TIGR03848 family)
MATILLVRHGMTPITGKRLAGWTPGLHLSDEGRGQADGLVERLRDVPLDAIYASPLERCRETALPLARARDLRITARKDLGEVKYGDWTDGVLADLRKDKLWPAVMHLPSSVRFPGGESFLEAQHRAVAEVERIAAAHPGQTVACFTHADLIRLVLAHFLGVHLDLFQRIAIDTCSVSVLALGTHMPMLLKMNDTGPLKMAKPEPKPKAKKAKAAAKRTTKGKVTK